MCSKNITPIIEINTLRTCHACPVKLISRKMPKIYTGSNGMSTTSIVLATISLNSSKPGLSVLEPKKAMPSPTVNAVTRADITSTSGGMLMVKNGSKLLISAISSTS